MIRGSENGGSGAVQGDGARPSRGGERGHLLVGLVVLIAVMIIMLTAAAQSWTFLVRRDREAELIQRGEEYARAIAFFQKENQSYPLKLDQLLEKGPHGHRFIRKLYPDPLAEDGEWGLLYLSPTGKGFVNPYATQLGDPFADPFAGPVDTGFGSSRRGKNQSFRKHPSSSSPTPGYSEISPKQLKAMGGANLPIVGVVHKEQEWGIKIYKGQASINDWAFTMMAEGQDHNPGAGKGQKPPTRQKRPMGIGDHTAPIFLPGMLPPPPNAGTTNVHEEMLKEHQRQQQEEEQRRREEEERRRQLLIDAGIDPDDPYGESSDEEGDPDAEDGEGDEEGDEAGDEGNEDDGLYEDDADGDEGDEDPGDDGESDDEDDGDRPRP